MHYNIKKMNSAEVILPGRDEISTLEECQLLIDQMSKYVKYLSVRKLQLYQPKRQKEVLQLWNTEIEYTKDLDIKSGWYLDKGSVYTRMFTTGFLEKKGIIYRIVNGESNWMKSCHCDKEISNQYMNVIDGNIFCFTFIECENEVYNLHVKMCPDIFENIPEIKDVHIKSMDYKPFFGLLKNRMLG